MASPQLMRSVLSKLSEPRTFEKGLFMAREQASDLPPPPAASTFRQRFEVVFVDASGWLNLMADVTRSALQHVSVSTSLWRLLGPSACMHWRYKVERWAHARKLLPNILICSRSKETKILCCCLKQAQQAAARTVKLLDGLASSEDAFDAAFLANHASAATPFDCVVHVALPAAADAALATADTPAWRYAPCIEAPSGLESLQRPYNQMQLLKRLHTRKQPALVAMRLACI